MKFGKYLCISIMVCFGAFAVHQLVAGFVSVHKWPQLSASDWGTWVGSVGTVATLIGTIWLATDSERTKRNEARDRAFVAASGLMLLLRKVQAALETATDHFSDSFFEERGFEYAVQARLLEAPGIWTEEQILPLLVIPNHVCAHLARARADIFDIVNSLLEMQEIQGYSWVQETKKDRDDTFLYRLGDCCDTVSFCVRECHKFIKKVEATNLYIE